MRKTPSVSINESGEDASTELSHEGCAHLQGFPSAAQARKKRRQAQECAKRRPANTKSSAHSEVLKSPLSVNRELIMQSGLLERSDVILVTTRYKMVLGQFGISNIVS